MYLHTPSSEPGPSAYSQDRSTLYAYLRRAAPLRLRPPTGNLRHPFVDPGNGYEDIQWDWDAFFCLFGLEPLAAEDQRIGIHARGCVDNFLERQGPDGHVPYAITPASPSRTDAPRSPNSERNSTKPLLAQFVRLVQRCGTADSAWLISVFPKLEASVQHWFESQSTPWGLLTWRSHRGSGSDNHPAYFLRPHNQVADPFLNAMMVRECRALAEMAQELGRDPAYWLGKADQLAAAVERWMWDPIDGAYYCVDVGRGDPGRVRTPAYGPVLLKVRSWSVAMPLWAGIAAPERAARVVHEHLLAPQHLRCPYGIRSLSPAEPAYQIFADFNPSDWCGPVWVISTYLIWQALMDYGYTSEAQALANDHLRMLAQDLADNEVLHEYYHPDTGRGLTHPGFINWNTCALRMMA